MDLEQAIWEAAFPETNAGANAFRFTAPRSWSWTGPEIS